MRFISRSASFSNAVEHSIGVEQQLVASHGGAELTGGQHFVLRRRGQDDDAQIASRDIELIARQDGGRADSIRADSIRVHSILGADPLAIDLLARFGVEAAGDSAVADPVEPAVVQRG